MPLPTQVPIARFLLSPEPELGLAWSIWVKPPLARSRPIANKAAFTFLFIVLRIYFIRVIVHSNDVHEPPLDTEAERPRGFGELQPHHMPGGKGHVPQARVVSDFRLLA